MFLTFNKVTEQNRHQKMACGICNELQEMEVQFVATGFAEFLWLEAER